MKRIINYTTGGLGNRLRPLSSAYAISKSTGREFCQYWDSDVTNGSLAKFDELFENKITLLSTEELEGMKSYKIYSDYDIIVRLSSKYKLSTLKNMVDKESGHLTTRANYKDGDSEENVILYCNNFFSNTDRNLCNEFIQSLRPIKEIQDKIDLESTELGLNKNIIGIHARGTDFNCDVSYYTHQIDDFLKNNSDAKFFLSTDDAVYENIICNTFGDRIITRSKRLHLQKVEQLTGWDYNFLITKEKSQDSVVDLFLLSKTNIKIFNPNSTFYEVAQIISQKNN